MVVVVIIVIVTPIVLVVETIDMGAAAMIEETIDHPTVSLHIISSRAHAVLIFSITLNMWIMLFTLHNP